MDAATQSLLSQHEPKELRTIVVDLQLLAARYSPCGRVLAGASYDGRVRRWNATTDEYIEIDSLGGHNAWCTAIAFRADGDWMYSADSWGQLRAWNGADGLDQPVAPTTDEALKAAAAAQPRWRVEQAHDGWIRELAVSPDGQTLASCGADGRVKLWSTTDGSPRGELAAYGSDLYCLRYASDGQTIFTGDDRGLTKQWKLDGTLVREFAAAELHLLSRLQDVGGVRAMAVSADGSQLAIGGTIPKSGATITGEPLLVVFDIATGERKMAIKLGDATAVNVVDLHFHPAGFWMAVTSGSPGNGKLVYVRTQDSEPFFQTNKPANAQSLSLRPDGKQLAVVATNANSNLNGRAVDKDGNYLSNQSPIHLFTVDHGAS